MPVTHQALAAIIGELVGMAAEQGGHFGLDRLRQQRSHPIAQHLGQRIGECPWLGKLENISLARDAERTAEVFGQGALPSRPGSFATTAIDAFPGASPGGQVALRRSP
jgi:hypothetical protein